jgi:hypothetical protein
MEVLFAVALMAGLLLPIELLRFTPSWVDRVADRVSELELVGDSELAAATDGSSQGVEMTVEWGLFTSSFIRRRLDALAEELDRLDRDPDIFAKAFHTTVARSAYEALRVDASKLSDQPWTFSAPTLEFELIGPSTGTREELEL